jgi:Uma2 family endonuclease
MATAELLLTAEQYRLLPDDGQPTELVRGRVVPVNVPAPRHGQIASKVDRIVGNYYEEHELGHVVTCDSGIITERDPDTVRGADVAFYSYSRMPRGPLPPGYLPVPPELVFEVRSPTDRWRDVLAKVVEYLDAGVTVVCIVDPGTETVHVYRADRPVEIIPADGELTIPEVLGGFRVPVRRFFE